MPFIRRIVNACLLREKVVDENLDSVTRVSTILLGVEKRVRFETLILNHCINGTFEEDALQSVEDVVQYLRKVYDHSHFFFRGNHQVYRCRDGSEQHYFNLEGGLQANMTGGVEKVEHAVSLEYFIDKEVA